MSEVGFGEQRKADGNVWAMELCAPGTNCLFSKNWDANKNVTVKIFKNK